MIILLLQNEFKIECALSEYNYKEKLLIKCVHSILKGILRI